MKKTILYLFAVCLLADLTGCASLRKKFIRKKRKEEAEKSTVVLALEDYDKLIDYHNLYKKHFLLWQYWCDELISSFEMNYKKQKVCADQSLENLSSLKKYVTSSKKEPLGTYIQRFEKIKLQIDRRKISNDIEKSRTVREIEKLKRLVDKEYRYSKIKAFIIKPVEEKK